MTRYLVAGGAGFIGSHLVPRLLGEPDAQVTVLDNLSSGSAAHLAGVRDDERLQLVEGDLQDLDSLIPLLDGIEHVYQLAANPDIAKAATEPGIDFWQGTYLTHNLLEACRLGGVDRISYMSGSGVYGDLGETPVSEARGPLLPVSTYGASKLACEALISAYCHMFGLRGVAFRFANVVGPGQTHGVTYDFVRRLMEDPGRLTIRGDGRQSKSYIHINDVLDAVLLLADMDWQGLEVYNVATEDYVTVTEIADMVVEQLGLKDVPYEYTGGPRGWKGDVPVVRFESNRIRARGWSNRLSSQEALADSIKEIVAEARGDVGPRD